MTPTSVPGTLCFECNVCSSIQHARIRELDRERASCDVCDSTLRWRGVISALSQRLFKESLSIGKFPPHAAELTGLGMSDWHGYAERLGAAVRYTNTFYDRSPQLDIMAEIPEQHLGRYDFVLSSDVMEHVPAPVRRGFSNIRRLLRDGGTVVLTVPFAPEGETREHFGLLESFEVIATSGGHVLRGRRPDGSLIESDQVVFHGGDGFTVEMRLFALSSLLDDLRSTGFDDIVVHDQPDYEHGIVWPHPWSLPISARASRGAVEP